MTAANVPAAVVDVAVLSIGEESPKAPLTKRACALIRLRFLQTRRADKHTTARLVGLAAQVRLQLAIPDREQRPVETVRRRPADRINLMILVVHHRRQGEL